MLHTVEAVIDQQGHVKWLEDIELQAPQRVLITFVDAPAVADETLALSEAALREGWINDQEDAAWAHLQPEA